VRRVVIDDRKPTLPVQAREYFCAGCEGTGTGSTSVPPMGWLIVYEVTNNARTLHGYFCCKPCMVDWVER
jgi:hypothetical protein